MGWNDQKNGQLQGNRPSPNDTQATQDYNRGYSEKIAADNAARAAQQNASIFATPPASTYTPTAPTYTPTTGHSPSVSSPSTFTPSASYSGGSYGRGSMTEEQTTALLYPDVVARRAKAQEAKKPHKTPWAAIFLGIIVGYGVALVPFALSGNFYHSAYLDKMGVSMATFCAFIFWAIVELTRGRGRAAFATALLGFFIPEVFWLTNGVTFLQAYSIIFTRAVSHLTK